MMNNFTREELFDLKYAIEKLKQPAKDSLGFYKLRDKIQSMIDNYNLTTKKEIKLQDNEWG